MTPYELYLFDCYCQGDIWNTDYRPYTQSEWQELNKPKTGGILKNDEF